MTATINVLLRIMSALLGTTVLKRKLANGRLVVPLEDPGQGFHGRDQVQAVLGVEALQELADVVHQGILEFLDGGLPRRRDPEPDHPP